jgi:putative phosphoesterase
MKIGIMSDSHDKMSNIKKAITIFKEEEVKVILHAGDLISPFCVGLFENFKGNFHLCNGNNLGDTKLIKRKMEGIGHFYEEMGEIELGGFKFVLYHGTDEAKLQSLLDSQKYDYVITGHTHHRKN